LLLLGNPLEEKGTQDGTWVNDMSSKFPKLKKLDGKVVFREEAQA
jgi:hypothetical protein